MNNKVINKIALLLLIAIFFISDRFLKLKAIELESPLTLIDNFLYFSFYPNKNIALSLPVSNTVALIFASLVTIAIFFIILNLIKQKKPTFLVFFLSLIFAGSVSNIFDRINYGFVVDYLLISNINILNIADLMISLSSIVLIIYFLQDKK